MYVKKCEYKETKKKFNRNMFLRILKIKQLHYFLLNLNRQQKRPKISFKTIRSGELLFSSA